MPISPAFSIRRACVAVLVAGAALALSGEAATAAPAPVPTANVLYGCVAKKGGTLRIVDRPARCNKKRESAIAFNAVGQQGATGAPGPKGETGAQGAPGPAGADGTALSAADFQTKLNAATVTNSQALGGVAASGYLQGSQFNSRFTTQLQSVFGSTPLTTDNTGGGGSETFMAEVFLTAANFPPPGTAFASGQTLSINQNSALYSLIGTQYGGDGVTTFRLPNLNAQAPAGGVRYVIKTLGSYPSRP